METNLIRPLPARTYGQHYISSKVGYTRRKVLNIFLLGLTGALTLLALVPLFWIIGYVIYKGSSYINLALFTQMPRPMGITGGGVLHAIEGTLILIVLATIFSVPPGILAAFYAAYYPNTPLGIALRFGTDVLSGVPSIVIGIFGYAILVKPVGHYSALAGGIAMAMIMLPTIIRTAEEMIKLVPRNLREGALALGSPEWRAALQVTLPAAMNGIITGFILSLARAAGETAPLLFTALGNDRFDLVAMVKTGINMGKPLPAVLFNIIQQPVDSLPLTLYKYTQQPFPENINQAWAVAFVLLVLVLVTNIATRAWIARSNKNSGGRK
jgi:phosphate transport system permease protein